MNVLIAVACCSDEAITGVSLYNVTPDKAAYYFNKIQCFCFEQQRLQPREAIDMPVLFYIDPEFAADWKTEKITDLTLAYNFFRVEDDDIMDGSDESSAQAMPAQPRDDESSMRGTSTTSVVNSLASSIDALLLTTQSTQCSFHAVPKMLAQHGCWPL